MRPSGSVRRSAAAFRPRSLPRGAAVAAALAGAPALAQTDAEYAQQLANPVSSLISLPLQVNYDGGFGPRDGEQVLLNIQPVVPFSVSEDFNLISRTILPVVSRDDVAPAFGSQFGFGNVLQSLFLSPKQPVGGAILGAGPVLLIPTATDGIATNQWAAGPSAVALSQTGPWTAGALVNHLWSLTGGDRGSDVSATFLQPFVTYTTPSATSFFVNAEATYDWEGAQWSVPINVGANQVLRIGDQLVQLGAGLRYWVESPDFGPSDVGARLTVTFLFPRR